MDLDTNKHPGALAHTSRLLAFVSETRKEATADVRLSMADRRRGQSRAEVPAVFLLRVPVRH